MYLQSVSVKHMSSSIYKILNRSYRHFYLNAPSYQVFWWIHIISFFRLNRPLCCIHTFHLMNKMRKFPTRNTILSKDSSSCSDSWLKNKISVETMWICKIIIFRSRWLWEIANKKIIFILRNLGVDGFSLKKDFFLNYTKAKYRLHSGYLKNYKIKN